MSIVAACLTAIAATVVLRVTWPRPLPAPTQGSGIALSAATVSVTDKAALIRIAEKYVRLQAERQIGVSVDRQQVTGFSKHGNLVVVSLHDMLSNWDSKKTFDVDVTLNEGAWQPLGMHVVTEYGGAPPMGIPAPAS